MASTDGQFLKPAQVARRLNISVSQVHRIMRAGELPHLRIGKQSVRVRPEDLERYIESLLNGETIAR